MTDPMVRHYDDAYYARGHAGNYADPGLFQLMALYWKEEIFVAHGLDPRLRVLDWGAGFGNRSVALEDSVCYDPSPAARRALDMRRRAVAASDTELERGGFDCVLCAHVLEHMISPAEGLAGLRQWLRPAGKLVLILPVERETRPAGEIPDENQHLFAWTFRTATNLLAATGWRTLRQSLAYEPLGLRTLAFRCGLPAERAVAVARRLGRLKPWRASLLFIAEPSGLACEEAAA